jgi:hypothetical protein
MFTGFASENTPAIQVWDLFRAYTGQTIISLADDCAPIQYFKTGANTTAIQLFLPTAPIEGQQIQIVNARYTANNQSISIFASDVSAGGTSNTVATLGQGQTLVFCYSKNFISFGTSAGLRATGWITLNQSPAGALNYNSSVSGGSLCTAIGSNAFVGGGSSNSASQSNAFIGGGSSNTASGSSSCVGGGFNNIASNTYSFVGGGSNNTAGAGSSFIGGGTNHTANASNSIVVGGSYGSVRSIFGNTVFPASINPIASSAGVSQSALLVLGVQTTNATATVLRNDANAATTTNQVILPNNSAYVFQGTCIANVTGGSTTSGWEFQGVIKRGANAASTTLVAAVTPTVIAQDLAAATWVLAITADTTNGGIAVTVTGAAATTIRWVSKIETTEVTF